jgi:hypothetical protein
MNICGLQMARQGAEEHKAVKHTSPDADGREITDVDLRKLEFDSENPRLPRSIDPKDEAAVLEYMLSDATIVELMGSIGALGYFAAEPLLVTPSNKSGRFVVVEGNRRLAAVKLLENPALAAVKKNAVREASEAAQYKPSKLPVIEFAHRKEILLYLGFRHVTGVKAWDSLAKARYLEKLRASLGGRDDDRTYQDLARAVGSRSDYVKRLLASYNIYRHVEDHDFYGIEGLNDTTFNFSLLTTALFYSKIASFLGLSDASDPLLKGLKVPALKDLVRWLSERNAENRTRLGESRNLKILSAVVSTPAALQHFRNGESLEQAAVYTEEPTEFFTTSLIQAKTKLQAAQANVHLVQKPNNVHFETLREIAGIAKTLNGALRAQCEDVSDD